MRLVIQRVSEASVSIEGNVVASIGQGFLVLLGIEDEDQEDDLVYVLQKLIGLRIFSDQEGKMNLDLKQVNGDLLVVSQFTLHASTKKGNRPSFMKAARPEKAIPLYEKFLQQAEKELGKAVQRGEFGADMNVMLINDGPVTILLDSKNRE